MRTPTQVKTMALAALCLIAATPISAQTLWYVDDDAPGDPGPGDPAISDPLENGTPGHPFDAIQEGVNAAANGDTVLVLDGTYTGVGNRDISFGGRLVTVRSESGPENCVVDLAGASYSRAFLFQSGETEGAVLDGLAITGGWHMQSGTGIFVYGAAPMVKGCVFSGNYSFWGGGATYVGSGSAFPTTFVNCRFLNNSGGSSSWGGAAWVEGGSAVFVQCLFIGNSARHGGALYVTHGTVALTHCEFRQNTAIAEGGAISFGRLGGEYPTLTNCTFIGNIAGSGGGGIAVWDLQSGGVHVVWLRNCTFAGNEASAGRSLAANTAWADYFVYNSILWEPDAVLCSGGAGFYCYYSDVQGYGGGTNIDEDPEYVDPSSGNYRLGPSSPCIDAANTAELPPDTYDLDGDGDTSEPIPMDLDREPRTVDDPNTTDTGVGFPCVDMGAYELQPGASGVGLLPGESSPIRIWSAAPNPVLTQMTIAFSVASGEIATVAVFDMLGRRVAALTDAAVLPGGLRQLTWDGRTSGGRPAPAGVYLIQLRTSHGTDSRVIRLLR